MTRSASPSFNPNPYPYPYPYPYSYPLPLQVPGAFELVGQLASEFEEAAAELARRPHGRW